MGSAHRRQRLTLGLLALLAAAGAAVALAASAPPGRISPQNHIQNNGRLLNPIGHMVRLGNFPTGGALTRDGHFFWTLSAGRGRNDIRIVQVARVGHRRAGRVVQIIPMPGLSGGMVMAPDGRTAYVSGVAESSHKDQQTAANVPGKQGDVIHVFRYDRRTGHATRDGVIPVPPPSSAPPYQDLPIPTPNQKRLSWPRDLAISSNGRTILAALNLADTAAIVDTKTRKARYVSVGHYPYGVAISRDGKRGFVTSETQGRLDVIDLHSASDTGQITVGPPLSHPEGMASDTRSNLVFVAVTHQDNIVAVDTRTLKVVRTIHVGRPQGLGTFPTSLRVTRDGCSLLSANSGEDSVVVIALSRKRTCDRGARHHLRGAHAFAVVGRLPVGSYPTAVDATPARRTLVWLSARGLGTGPNPRGPNPLSTANNDNQINRFQYLPSFVRGSAGYAGFPTDSAIARNTARVSRQLVPTDTRKPPAGTPLRANGPIKHVFYIVKENRTYDQMLGDDPRGDGDPKLTLFGKDQTPNLHALARRFPLLDHVYANSEASIDGHYWTSAGAVSDYVVKAWHQNYGGRGRPYDFGAYEVSAPPKNYLFQRAEQEGISYFNYGEALAGVSPFADKDRPNGGADDQLNKKVLAKSDVGTPLPPPFCYESDLSNSTVLSTGKIQVYDSSVPSTGADPGSKSRFDCFRNRFLQQLATKTVPAFSYLVLPNDHTEGTTPGRRTPRAQIASNDYGMGQIVDQISHSSIWDSSVVIVVEDDSQDGADHVDAHRIPALAISPFTRKGAVIHDRYDQLSFIRSLELIVGMKPRNLAEALSVPLYSAFNSAPANNQPYSAIVPKQSLTEQNTASSPGASRSQSLHLGPTDNVPQRVLDRLLWQSVHGAGSEPPPPGPNAVGGG